MELRQQLKDLCNQREPQPLPTAARSHPTSVRRRSGFPTDGGVESAVHRGKEGDAGEVGSVTLAKSIKVLLSSKRFPSKLAFGGALLLRLERRKALHAFMAELVRERGLLGGKGSNCSGTLLGRLPYRLCVVPAPKYGACSVKNML